ncbi:MAG: CHAT domain-containing protein, partial [Balneolales bacterium]
MFFAAVLIFINSSVFSLDREPENSFVQADFFIEALLTDADAFEYFWGLNELASAHPGVEQYAVETLRNLNLPAYGACLLQSFANADHIETASQRKLERLRMGFECKRDAFLLIAYLYEMPPSQAPSYAKEMNPVPAATGPQTALINKAVGKPYDVEQLFAPRPFELSDIYLFHRLSFEPEKAHFINDLLDRWTQQYLRTGSHRMRHHLMLATIVNGQSHHSSGRNSQDHKVYEVLHLFNDGELMLPNSKYKLNLYKRLGFSTNFIGNYRDAVQFYRRRVLPLSELIHDKQEQLRVRLDFGTILFRTGNLQAARQEYETVYNDSTGIQDSRYRSELMNNLAVTYLNSGNFTDYLQFQLDALNESNEANYINGKLHYLNNLAIYYQKSENWSSALSYLNAAARIAEDADIPAELSTIYRSIGIYERDQNNDFETAVFYLSASENLAIESGSYRQLLVTRSELSDTYIRMSEPERALEIYHKIEKEAFERDNHSGWLEVQAQIASLYLGQQMIEEAGQYIHLLEDSSIENLQFRPRVEAVNVLAEYYFKTDEPGKGYALSELYTRQIIERLQNSADYQSGHLRIDKEFIHNFQITTDLLLHSGKEEQVLTFFDELKNVSKFSFYNNPALKSNLLNEEELFYDYALGNRIERLRNERRGAGASDMMAINNQISLATNERNKLTERVLGELDREAFDLDNVQQKLKRDEVILYYTLFRNKLYLATISSSDVKITNQTFSTGEMRRMEQAIKDLSNGDTRLGELHWIYNKIIPADVDDSYNKLIVVPDGFLYRLPLDVLPVSGALSDHSFGSARYLIEDFAVTYVNSLKDFEDVERS